MTTIVIWKMSEEIYSDIPTSAVWAMSDSRLSVETGTLTENCAKLFEIDMHCAIRQDMMEPNSSIEMKTITAAVAGNTAVAHNVVFSLQQGLRRLVGSEMPTLLEVAEFATRIATRITKEVGFVLEKRSLGEIVLIGPSDDQLQVISLKPTLHPTLVYETKVIPNLPYAFGSGAGAFMKEYARRSAATNHSSLSQLPIRIFDELFLSGKVDENTGGDIQMIATKLDEVRRFSPIRWSTQKQAYTSSFYGEEIAGRVVGKAWIANDKWQLDDI